MAGVEEEGDGGKDQAGGADTGYKSVNWKMI
jgi:hypothetical protein